VHAQPEIRTGAAQVWTGTQLPVGTGEVERARAARQDPGPNAPPHPSGRSLPT